MVEANTHLQLRGSEEGGAPSNSPFGNNLNGLYGVSEHIVAAFSP